MAFCGDIDGHFATTNATAAVPLPSLGAAINLNDKGIPTENNFLPKKAINLSALSRAESSETLEYFSY